MTARAIWKAELHCGEATVPVKLYSAVQDRNVRFHLLHDQDLVRVEQRMVNPKTNRVVAYDEQRRGYEVDRGLFTILSPEELASLEPEASRDIVIERFVEPDGIDRSRFQRPYWLAPDGDTDAYFAFVAALADAETIGVARWVMRKKNYLGALSVYDEYLLLTTLRSEDETISTGDLASPAGRELSSQETQLANQLVSALEADFEPEQFQDEYRERLLKLIETKRHGKTIPVETYVPKKPKPSSLVASLRSSLEAVR